jgi:hypothetical protein
MATYAEVYEPHYQSSFAAAEAQQAERHVLAERYRTKMCRNYATTGACPYEVRCMFAHGEHELRTTEQNVRDGLITEEAIKAFQRALNLRHRNMMHLGASYAIQEYVDAAPEYVGVPPPPTAPDRYVHNPYGYAVVRPHTPEELYLPAREITPFKVDPSAAIEP